MGKYSFSSKEKLIASHELAIIGVKSSNFSDIEKATESYIENMNKILTVFDKYEEDRKKNLQF